MPGRLRLIWHRRDLRLRDNPLYSGLREGKPCLGLYVFNKRDFTPRPSTCDPARWDAVNVGPHAARLLVEAVSELRNSVHSLDGELLVRVGDPATVVPEVAQKVGADEVWWCEEPGVYEGRLSRLVRQRLGPDVKVSTHVCYTLFHPDDLPRDPDEWTRLVHPKQKHGKKKRKENKNSVMHDEGEPAATATEGYMEQNRGIMAHEIADVSQERLKGMPRVMGDFRRAARMSASVRETLPPPTCLTKPAGDPLIDAGDIPTLEELVKPLMTASERPLLGLRPDTVMFVVRCSLAQSKRGEVDPEITHGGESWAMKRLHRFIHGGYAATADRSLADVSGDGSSKFSAHLSLGTLSPRTVYEAAASKGEPCHWLISHLEMRDFFLYTTFASGNRLFCREGIPVNKKTEPIAWRCPADDSETAGQWRRWATGETGLPLVDAAIIELLSTGYCSNRVRQNAASVLSKDLSIDWRAGAEWFQFLLEDHCVGANWGNWLYFSGVGPDPKQRHFRTVSQALRYDPNGAFVKKWIPRLADEMNQEAVFHPWDFIIDWKQPIIDPQTQFTWQDLQQLQGKGQLVTEH